MRFWVRVRVRVRYIKRLEVLEVVIVGFEHDALFIGLGCLFVVSQ
jgi:hypothetical protein